MICPRSAILQSAAASSVAGIFELTVSTAARIATFGRSTPNDSRQVDRVLADVHLVLERRRDVDRTIGDDQHLVVGGHVHQEHVTEPAAGAHPAFPRHHRAQEFVGVEAALHQDLRFALAHESHRLRRGGVAFADVHDFDIAELDALGLGDLGDRRRGTDQDGVDQALACGVDRAGQCRLLARPGYGGGDGVEASTALQQTFVFTRSRLRHRQISAGTGSCGAASAASPTT